MHRVEVLVATVNNEAVELISQMGITGDAVIANQTKKNVGFTEATTEHGKVLIISHPTIGVGKNRNMGLTFASHEILLFSDDDVTLSKDYEQTVEKAFDKLKNADAIIFNIDTDSKERKQYQITRIQKCGRFSRMPYGACRIAVRRDALMKANIHFSELFGGGCIFPSGEDSILLRDFIVKGLRLYVYPATIGKVSFEQSSWFTGGDERYFYGKGAMYECSYPFTKFMRYIYIALRIRNSPLKFSEKVKWMKAGSRGFHKLLSYEAYTGGNGG